MVQIAPSILSADFLNLKRDVLALQAANADLLHIDIMDGNFVPNLSFGPQVVEAIKNITPLKQDVHLMIEQPQRYLETFIQAGADTLLVHVEATPHIHRVIQQIKQAGVKAGIVLNPGTPVSQIEPLLSLVDQVLVMTVNPGFGGQTFIETMTAKIKQLAQIRQQENYAYLIEVDGGINDQTIKSCVEAGADICVAGSYVFKADLKKQINHLKEAIK